MMGDIKILDRSFIASNTVHMYVNNDNVHFPPFLGLSDDGEPMNQRRRKKRLTSRRIDRSIDRLIAGGEGDFSVFSTCDGKS